MSKFEFLYKLPEINMRCFLRFINEDRDLTEELEKIKISRLELYAECMQKLERIYTPEEILIAKGEENEVATRKKRNY